MSKNNGKCPDESLKRPNGCKVVKTCFQKKKEKDINTDSHRLQMVPRIPETQTQADRQSWADTTF